MHNKVSMVDGRVALVGGRNIGDDYFDASEQVKFEDTDLLSVGAPELQAVRAASMRSRAKWALRPICGS
ncbi:hypothetical protein [Janthinobacterium sp. ROICE36]|uniref:hypothetical protein n=1 Tax=Janthinobacterium sp. ROICE36 TaxID=2048670 RepID=UPI002155BD51|nr:hypothetical protein [Janthinobacterium sp. ROICE36]